MALMIAQFSDGHRVHYTGNKMNWAWQIHRPEATEWDGKPRATMLTGFSGTKKGACDNALKHTRYEYRATMEIRELKPQKDES